jgi:hypothetical protein
VIVFFFNPAKLTGVIPKTEKEKEIEKTLVRSDGDGGSLSLVQNAQAAPSTEVLVVTKSDALTRLVLSKRYARVTIKTIAAQMPDGSTLVANEIEGADGGALTGKDFSVIARRLANLQINANGQLDPPISSGSIWIYAKILENDILSAKGAAGKPGADGANGHPGADGGNGRNADCGGFGAYHGAGDGQDGGTGGNGEEGQNGMDGQAGGQITVTTDTDTVSTSHAVDGGAGGTAGRGGAAGAGGRGGGGGRGCMGLGGHAADGANGRPGLSGSPGRNASVGNGGSPGHYQLKIVQNFDRIAETLTRLPNEQLHAALKAP